LHSAGAKHEFINESKEQIFLFDNNDYNFSMKEFKRFMIFFLITLNGNKKSGSQAQKMWDSAYLGNILGMTKQYKKYFAQIDTQKAKVSEINFRSPFSNKTFE
jgi:hypothetical protein